MSKTKAKKQSDKATLAEVTKEMAKPRIAKSAREQTRTFQSNPRIVENKVKK